MTPRAESAEPAIVIRESASAPTSGAPGGTAQLTFKEREEAHEKSLTHDLVAPTGSAEVRATPMVQGGASPAPVVAITTPAFAPGWREEVTQHLTQFVLLRHDRAEIRLNPSDLGPITVQIRIEGGEANLLIQAPQPATRDGLQLALPELRDSLAQQGITLGQASVQDERQRPDDGTRRPLVPPSSDAEAGSATAIGHAVARARGLVDLFA